MLKDLVTKSRSYRRFEEDFTIEKETLIDLVSLARLAPSGANLQPLKYLLSADRATNETIFPHLNWAGYLKDWSGPVEGERPTGYIVVLGDRTIAKNFGCDQGISAQTILLGACEKGLGGCMFSSIKHDSLRAALALPEEFEVLLVIALGKVLEEVAIEDLDASGSVRYWRDDKAVHHVPKRSLDDIILTL